MEPAEREDLLLAVIRLESRNQRSPLAEDIVGLVQRSLPDVQNTIKFLIDCGELVIDEAGFVKLTTSGEAAAAGVMKKHKVLETFFEEMLGMDRNSAHKQACTLEHHASEETINRLKCFIGTHFPSRNASPPPSSGSDCCILSDCVEGQRVTIAAVKGCGRAERLADLGLIPGEEVLIRRRMAKTFLIQVKGCDIAISVDIAKKILVEIVR